MDAKLRTLIARLHDAGFRCVVVVAGGGTGAAAWLLSVPGASRSILEVLVPYEEQSLCDFLGRRPASFCSAETARLMARRAFERACWLAPGDGAAGVACTASLQSDRPKRGEHRFHLAVQTVRRVSAYSLTFAKDARDREGEETVLDRVLLNALAETFGLAERLDVPLLPGEEIVAKTHAAEDALAALFAGRISALCVERDGRLNCDAPRPRLLLPGSFNPMHHGHRTLAAVAARLTHTPAAFELGIVNANKPSLSAQEVRYRMGRFTGQGPLWLTRAATFAEKAELFPDVVFAVGADTAARIVEPRFYGGSETRLDEAMARLRRHGCRFLVAGRINAAGVFVGPDDLHIPAPYRDLFTAIPSAEFRLDISSTQLRKINSVPETLSVRRDW